jgi:hypothetical protein
MDFEWPKIEFRFTDREEFRNSLFMVDLALRVYRKQRRLGKSLKIIVISVTQHFIMILTLH